jgi:hypothetical protein
MEDDGVLAPTRGRLPHRARPAPPNRNPVNRTVCGCVLVGMELGLGAGPTLPGDDRARRQANDTTGKVAHMPTSRREQRNGSTRPLGTSQRERTADIVLEDYLLRRAAHARTESERQVADAVAVARSAGVSWARIGQLLGTTAEAARERHRTARLRAS